MCVSFFRSRRLRHCDAFNTGHWLHVRLRAAVRPGLKTVETAKQKSARGTKRNEGKKRTCRFFAFFFLLSLSSFGLLSHPRSRRSPAPGRAHRPPRASQAAAHAVLPHPTERQKAWPSRPRSQVVSTSACCVPPAPASASSFATASARPPLLLP